MARHARPSDRQDAETARAEQPCERCDDGTCRSCAQRRRHAWKLVCTQGLSVAATARRMGLTEGRVRLLVAQERERRDLKQYRSNQVPSERLRALVEQEMARNPELTRAHLSHYLQMRQIDLDRQLGYAAGATGAVQQHISVTVASRIAIALGHDPHEIDGV